MAFDGVTVKALVKELSEKLAGGRILKIIQPQKDELILTIKNYDQFYLLLSADASLPLVYLTSEKKEAPLVSPAFCMLLRKYLTNARIIEISSPGLERIVNIDLEHYDELGDLCRKRLIIELMGKHSNIIFCDENGKILDSIKRVPAFVSSVREVLPGRDYFIPQTAVKLDPLSTEEIKKGFEENIHSYCGQISKAIYMTFTGISPLLANECMERSGIAPEAEASQLSCDELLHLSNVFARMMDEVMQGSFSPVIYYDGEKPVEFGVIPVTAYQKVYRCESLESVSLMLQAFFAQRNLINGIKQRSSDLRRIVTNLIERETKKYELQLLQLKDTEKREECKVKGELLLTYATLVKPGEKEVSLDNYYTGEKMKITVDPDLSAVDNSKRYYDKYAKLKRTYEALSRFTVETKEVLDELHGLDIALDIARTADDLAAIRQELVMSGFMKDHSQRAQKQGKNQPKNGKNQSKPIHYVTEEGYDIFVGKNNLQNDELTFKLSEGKDWWFHAKGVPGSHVVLKSKGEDIPDRVFEKAAAVAAYYSKNRQNEKVEIDYLLKKNVKKPNGARPGYVVYYTNYSMVAVPGLNGVSEL